MKRYLISIAIWFGLEAALIIMFPQTSLLSRAAVRMFIPGEDEGQIFSIAYGVVAALSLIAALHWNPRFRLVVQGLILALSCAWATLLLVSAIAGSASFGGTLAWLWIIAIQASTIRYYDMTPEFESDITHHFEEEFQRFRDEERRGMYGRQPVINDET